MKCLFALRCLSLQPFPSIPILIYWFENLGMGLQGTRLKNVYCIVYFNRLTWNVLGSWIASSESTFLFSWMSHYIAHYESIDSKQIKFMNLLWQESSWNESIWSDVAGQHSWFSAPIATKSIKLNINIVDVNIIILRSCVSKYYVDSVLMGAMLK